MRDADKPSRKQQILGGLVLGGVIVAVVAGVSAVFGGDEPTVSQTNQTPPTAQTERASCDHAPETLQNTVIRNLQPQMRLADAYTVRAGDVIYLGANIIQGQDRVSSADVWVKADGALYALSGSANELSDFPDARDELGLSAGNKHGQRVQDCVIAALTA